MEIVPNSPVGTSLRSLRRPFEGSEVGNVDARRNERSTLSLCLSLCPRFLSAVSREVFEYHGEMVLPCVGRIFHGGFVRPPETSTRVETLWVPSEGKLYAEAARGRLERLHAGANRMIV